MEKLKGFLKNIWGKLRYPIQDFFYLILTSNWFTKTKAGKVVKVEMFYLLMCIASFMGAFALSADVQRGLEYSSFYQWMLMPFIILVVLRWTGVTFLGVVPISIQDKYWKTQIMNFADPKFAFQMGLYPNAEERFTDLKDLWVAEYGETISTTRANAPWQQSPYFQVSIIIICAIAGIFLGGWIF